MIWIGEMMISSLLVCAAVIVIPAQVYSAEKELASLIETEWERSMREDPTWASSLGDRRFNSKWPDLSLAAIEDSHQKDLQVLQKLNKINVNDLSRSEEINYRLFKREYENKVAAYKFRWYLVPLNQRGGIQTQGLLADSLRFEKLQDFDDWLARMNSFPQYMDQTIALMRVGAEEGIVHPKVVMQRLPAQIQRQIVNKPQRQLFYKPFFNIPDSISEVQKKRLRREAITAIQEKILPSYRKFLQFFMEEYFPASLDQVGVWQLPLGEEIYKFRCQEFTTTELTPTQIHSIGLAEVKRIRADMHKVIEGVGFEGTFSDFLDYLRTDSKFYYSNENDLLRGYMTICKRIDPQLVKLFKKLPRTPYGVSPIPPQLAPDTTTAYYRRPSSDGTRPGTYFVNLFRPETRPKYEMESLSLHEAVPGHHLQIALAQELDAIPRFRRYGGYTAFIEGWALYAESLGSELGMYQDPYSRFGQLTYEMWRAVRLVVDSGMHHQRWTREQAIEFFAANTAKSIHDIENEIDRYIVWPGQALAYKIGELKIQELRKRSESEFGERFDIREFHDVLLRNGAVSLDILEDQVNDWIIQEKSGR